MKTLQKKISGSILWIIIIVPILIMILFNLTARYYVNQSTAKELKNVVENIKELSTLYLDDELIDENGNQLSLDNINRLKVIRSALQVSKFSMNTEIVVVNAKGRVVFPQSYADTFLTDVIVRRALSKTVEEDRILRFFSGGKGYMFVYEDVEGVVADYKVLFIASAASTDALIRMMNLILVLALLVSTGVGVAVVLSVSKKISIPIVKASKATKRLGEGEYIQLDEESDCLEVHDLIVGMNQMSKKLKQGEEAQKDFLQNASHELRTPLMSIQGYAEGISNGIFKDAEKTAEIIAEESKRLTVLVDELLTLSRIEAGNYVGQFDTLNVSDEIKDYVQRATGYATMQKKTIHLTVPDEPLLILADESLLFKAVYNVLTNAIKYASSNVDVTVMQDQKTVVLRIEDDGQGISEKDLPHIFKRFYKGKNGNFGLGLAIAKTSVEFMGGKISARNTKGALFEISFPRKV
ncbi:MAG TPA: hypothetical protein DCQ90_03345 [Erysipelotrichaceae bacterium]|nr:hypothetical protein [Erysipelotrichaceae bacterium]